MYKDKRKKKILEEYLMTLKPFYIITRSLYREINANVLKTSEGNLLVWYCVL